MSEDDRRVDALVALARRASPPTVGSARRDDMIARALDEAGRSRLDGQTRAEPSAVRASWSRAARWTLAAAAIFALGFGGRAWLVPAAGAGATALSGTVSLPTGDRVTTRPSAALSIVAMSDVERILALDHGAALFDVAPLSAGERFVVRTPELEVHVRGTVFSVTREEDQTVVRVYEGHVEVREHGGESVLDAGQSYRSGAGLEPPASSDPFAEAGETAAARRRTHGGAPPVASALAATAAPTPVEPVGDLAAPVPTGPVPTGPVPTGPVPTGPVPTGPVPTGPVPTGPVPTGPVPTGAVPTGTVPTGTVRGSASTRAGRVGEGVRREEGAGAELRASEDPTPSLETTPSPIEASPHAPPSEATLEPAAATLAQAQALLRARRFEEALSATRGHASDGDEWAMLEAQALQGLGRVGEAADAYDDLARASPPSSRSEPAFRAATLRLRDLGDARGAVRSLDAADFSGGALEERALGLRARALAAAGDPEAAAAAARRYLERFPQGGLAAGMERLAH